jgi:hypothetical protein
VWYVSWYFWAANSPETHPTISQAEIQVIRTNMPLPQKNETIPWGHLLSKAPVWAIIINHFCSNWGFYVILTWLPSYFMQVLHVELHKVGLYTLLPWLVMFCMSNVAGWSADRLLKAGYSLTFVRKLMQTIGFHHDRPGCAVYVLRVRARGLRARWVWREPFGHRSTLRWHLARLLEHGRYYSWHPWGHADRYDP